MEVTLRTQVRVDVILRDLFLRVRRNLRSLRGRDRVVLLPFSSPPRNLNDDLLLALERGASGRPVHLGGIDPIGETQGGEEQKERGDPSSHL